MCALDILKKWMLSILKFMFIKVKCHKMDHVDGLVSISFHIFIIIVFRHVGPKCIKC